MIYNILRGGSKRGRRARGSSPWIPPLSLPSFFDERMKRKGQEEEGEEKKKKEKKRRRRERERAMSLIYMYVWTRFAT